MDSDRSDLDDTDSARLELRVRRWVKRALIDRAEKERVPINDLAARAFELLFDAEPGSAIPEKRSGGRPAVRPEGGEKPKKGK